MHGSFAEEMLRLVHFEDTSLIFQKFLNFVHHTHWTRWWRKIIHLTWLWAVQRSIMCVMGIIDEMKPEMSIWFWKISCSGGNANVKNIPRLMTVFFFRQQRSRIDWLHQIQGVMFKATYAIFKLHSHSHSHGQVRLQWAATYTMTPAKHPSEYPQDVMWFTQIHGDVHPVWCHM